MRIAVFGASGAIGSAVVDEAARRGHRVTALSRRPNPRQDGCDVDVRQADAGDPAQVLAIATHHDVVVTATRSASGSEHELVQVARVMLSAAARSGCRLLVVGGAATLQIPGSDGRTVLDDARHLSPAARPIAEACAAQFEVCRSNRAADWTYLSPPVQLVGDVRTGAYRVGRDELLVDSAGTSRISIPDLGAALLDEVESPRHRQQRFTIAY